MKKLFGTLKSGQAAYLYTISCKDISAEISDYGATVVKLFVPDKEGNVADVVLGFDDPDQYTLSGTFFGSVVGRNANRVGSAAFKIGEKEITLGANDGRNNLHSGPDFYKNRLWNVENHDKSSITLSLFSPDGDQGFPGNAEISVRYTITDCGELKIEYTAKADADTVFNFTNHSYFNLAGHDKPHLALEQELQISAEQFTPADAESIPTGELRSVAGSPLDFRSAKKIGRDIDADYDALNLQAGYDHNFVLCGSIAAVLSDSASGRTMKVITDCPGVQLYAGNYIADEVGKGGVIYPRRSGVCLETQFFPDSVNHPEWKSPVVKAGETYRSTTIYAFK